MRTRLPTRTLASVLCLLVLAGSGTSAQPGALSPEAREVVDRARTKVVVLKTRRSARTGSGTGFLARPNLVVTAAHVVTGITGVTAWVNGVAYAARVLDTHPQHDLALLRLQAPALRLKPVEMARGSAGLLPAEELVILAAPSQGPGADGEPENRFPIPAAFTRRQQLTDAVGRQAVLLSMAATVRKGDSGSPVLRVRDGLVVGVLSSREQPGPAGSRFAYAVPVEAVHQWLENAAAREAEGDFYLFRR